MTWNIGYAGLGEDSDFIMDHGEMILPPSQDLIMKNMNGILEYVVKSKPDIYLFQEIANYRFPGRKSKILDDIAGILEHYTTYYSRVVKIGIPFFRIKMGNAVSSKRSIEDIVRVDLPLDRGSIVGRFQKKNMLAAFVPAHGEKHWVIVNLHLSAFDEDAEVRREQLGKVRDYILGWYHDGNFVIVGGDWNLRLANTSWPHTTREEDLFWIHDLPATWTPKGWQWGIDTSAPTARTDEKPYLEGENHTSIIDGFLVSPNVQIEKVQTGNMDFKYSDHNPVTIWVRTARDH